jgi:hypothetical protein
MFSEQPDPSRGTRILSSFSINIPSFHPVQCKINNSYSACQTSACRIAYKVKKKKPFHFKGFSIQMGEGGGLGYSILAHLGGLIFWCQ